MSTRTSEFLAKVDEALAATADDGLQAACINGLLDGWERKRARLAEWAARDDDTPNPLGEGTTVFEVDATISGLRNRLDAIKARVLAKLAQVA